MKKLKEILFTPDDDGVTWFDIITGGIIIIGAFVGLALLIN